MRNYILVGMMLLLSVSIFAQKDKRDRDERIKSMKIAYITDKLDLSAADSEKFWPIYNAHEKEQSKIRASSKPSIPADEMTDADAKAYLAARLNAEEQMLALNRKYISDLQVLLSPKETATLFMMDREFKRMMLENIRGKRKGNKTGEKKSGMKQE